VCDQNRRHIASHRFFDGSPLAKKLPDLVCRVGYQRHKLNLFISHGAVQLPIANSADSYDFIFVQVSMAVIPEYGRPDLVVLKGFETKLFGQRFDSEMIFSDPLAA
jgi:hypothetical protein